MMRLLPYLLLLVFLASASAQTGDGFEVAVSSTDGLMTISINGNVWFEEREGLSKVFFKKDGVEYVRGDDESNPLEEVNTDSSSGTDAVGAFTESTTNWISAGEELFSTSFRVYASGDVLAFKQSFTNDEDIEGTSMKDRAGRDRGTGVVCSSYPSLVPNLNEGGPSGFWTYGGRMAGTPCISVGRLEATTNTIRDGNYGGVLTLFSEEGDEVVIISALNQFMVHNLYHRVNPDPAADASHPGVLDFGLMGSIEKIDAGGLELETVFVYGSSFEEAWTRWGQVLLDYNGGVKQKPSPDDQDFASDYLSFWTDNGGFYYYNTMEDMNYEETFMELSNRFKERGIPVKSAEIDSWWYEKDLAYAVVDWTNPLETVFPNGLKYLQEQTGFRMIAHNRYWSTRNIYVDDYSFERELISIPQDEQFWVDLFQNATEWDLVLYFQDWQDFQQILMKSTLSDVNVASRWLREMDAGARAAGVDIQYCMTMQRELLQSVQLPSVTRIRASEDYLLVEDQWKIGITSHATAAIGVKPYKDVFWTSSSNPGNDYYYDCMEVTNTDDPDASPWPLNYRYVGPINQTKNGDACLSWSALGLHWDYPIGDLVENYCRNPAFLYPQLGNSKPMCFYQADLSLPLTEWSWDECDIPVCEEDCTRNMDIVTAELPYCSELIEPNPSRMAAVSVLTTAGVGIGDDVENIDLDIVRMMCREDGRILSVDEPAKASPIQARSIIPG